MAEKKVTDEEIIEVLADPDILTQKGVAAELGISAVTLWQRKKDNPDIEVQVLELTKCATLKTVINGFKAMDAIINSTRSKAKDKIQAFKLILQYRGELTETRKMIGDKDNPLVVKLDDGISEEEAKLIAQSVIDNG